MATKSAFRDPYNRFTTERLIEELRALAERDTRTIPWSQIFRSVVHQAANELEILQRYREKAMMEALEDGEL